MSSRTTVWTSFCFFLFAALLFILLVACRLGWRRCRATASRDAIVKKSE